MVVEQGYQIEALIGNASKMIDSAITTCSISDAVRCVGGEMVGD